MRKIFIVMSVLLLFASSTERVAFGAENLSEQKNENKIEATDIVNYATLANEPAEEKAKALVEHKDAIKIVKEYLKEKNISIKSDIDDPAYQQFVLSLGTAFDLFNADEMEKLVLYVKFIDRYENFSKNIKINEFKNKLKNGATLSQVETNELKTLSPISSDAPSTQESGTSEEMVSVATVYSNGYNNIAARDYAYKWWDWRNPDYSYYAEKNGCSPAEECWNDCANFVSQALYAGGMEMYYGSHYTSASSWNYSYIVPSYSWGGAHNFYYHWRGRTNIADYVSALQTGDAVNADYTGDGDMEHTAIITKNWGSGSHEKFLTQHTTDRKEETTLADWFNSNFSVYGYEIDKASN